MTGFLKAFRFICAFFIIGILMNLVLASNLNLMLAAEGSTINSSTMPSNGSTINGDYIFRVDDQGDSTKCELYIDSLLVSYMKTSSGPWDWESEIGTYAWSDGWHVIRFDTFGGTGGDDSKSIFVRFDNTAPDVSNVQTIYPSGQTASKPGDLVTIVATVKEDVSGIHSVTCDTSYFTSTGTQVMYDDGNHLDSLSGDGIYGTPLIVVTNDIVGYHPVYVTAEDNANNVNTYAGEVGIDTIDPRIENVNVVYPDGQFSAKDNDKVRITAFINDEEPNVDIVLDIDRSGSMGWTEESSWMFQDIDISSVADNKSQARIRFSYDTDLSWRFSGWNIDDVKLTSDENPTGFWSANFENSVGNNNWQTGGEWELSAQPAGLGGSGGGLGSEGNPDPSSAYEGNRILGVDVTGVDIDGGAFNDLGDGNYGNSQTTFYATSPNINTLGQTNVHLTYYRWLNSDYPGTAPDYKPTTNSGDEHLIEVSGNGGTNYTTVWDNKQQKLFDAKTAAKIMVNHQDEKDRSAVYSFGSNETTFQSEVTRNQKWSSNKTEINNAIDKLNAFGGTPLWNSVVAAANYAGTSDTLKALIVLTDGVNNVGPNTLMQAIRAVQNNEVPTFTIGLGSKDAESDLKSLANAYPGGSYYFAASSSQLTKIYEDISNAVKKLRFPSGALVTYVNASALGGLKKVLMFDDGNHDDFLPGDDIYGSELITVSTSGKTDKINFKVHVHDVAGREAEQSGIVLVDNSMISISNSSVVYPGNKTNARDGENIIVKANIMDPAGVFPPVAPNGIASIYVDASSIGSSDHIDLFDDGNHQDNALNDGVFGSDTITVTTGYSIGTFIVVLHAKDNASNTASQQLNVKIDNSGPTSCNLIWPIDNITLEDTVKITARAEDDAGIDRVEIQIAGSSVWEKMIFNEGTGNYEIYFDTKTLTDGGPYILTVRAFDKSGDVPAYDSLLFGFFIDNTPPVLTINAPRNSDFVDGIYEINVTYSDPGLFKPVVEYKIDDTEWLTLTSTDGVYWTALWNTSNELDGKHTIQFRANDTIGNSVKLSVTVTIDNFGPTCTIVTPVENEYIQDKYTIKVLAVDTVGVKSVVITFMDENYTGIYNPQSGYYEYTIDTILIEEGARTIDAVATDLIGRIQSAEQVTFHIDNTAPRLTINSPSPGSFVEGEIFIDVSTSDVYLAITEYKIDGAKWISTAIPWDTRKVIDGIHTIEIRSYDLLLHETNEKIFVTVDNSEPSVSIHSPSYNQFLEDTFTFKVTAWDSIGIARVELELFNQTLIATLNTQTNYYEYTFSTRLYDDGVYSVKASVYDTSGKSKTTGEVQFKIDNNYPELVLVSPLSGDIIKGALSIDVLYDDVFLDKVEYKIDKGGYIDINNQWDSETLTDGEHTITVRAIDETGHETTLEFTIVVDNNAPEFSFVTPTANNYYTEFINVRLSAFDKVGIEKVLIRLDDSKEPIEIFKNPESGLYESSIDTKNLADGIHTIYAEVYDSNGFVSSKKLEFYTDNTGPVIEILSPFIEDKGDILFQFNVTDVNGVKTLLLNIDSSGWREITLAEQVDVLVDEDEGFDFVEVFSYSYIWPTTAEDNGKHFFVVKAIDNFGNEHVESREIEVKNVVVKVEEETDYLKIINDILPLTIFITALVLIIILTMLYYRGTIQKWSSRGLEKAARDRAIRPGVPATAAGMKRRGGPGRRAFDEYEDEEDDFDEPEDDYDYDDEEIAPVKKKSKPIRRVRSIPKKKKIVRKQQSPVRPIKRKATRSSYEDDSGDWMDDKDDNEGIDWD